MDDGIEVRPILWCMSIESIDGWMNGSDALNSGAQDPEFGPASIDWGRSTDTHARTAGVKSAGSPFLVAIADESTTRALALPRFPFPTNQTNPSPPHKADGGGQEQQQEGPR